MVCWFNKRHGFNFGSNEHPGGYLCSTSNPVVTWFNEQQGGFLGSTSFLVLFLGKPSTQVVPRVQRAVVPWVQRAQKLVPCVQRAPRWFLRYNDDPDCTLDA